MIEKIKRILLIQMFMVMMLTIGAVLSVLLPLPVATFGSKILNLAVVGLGCLVLVDFGIFYYYMFFENKRFWKGIYKITGKCIKKEGA